MRLIAAIIAAAVLLPGLPARADDPAFLFLGAFYYTGGTDDLDLGNEILFRYQVEAAYRFDDRSRLGFALSRYDNLGLGDTNPATDSFTMNYSIPLDGWF